MSNESSSGDLHMYPGGPIDAAFRWFSAIIVGSDLRQAWDITTEELRLALAQGWVLATGRDGAGADDRARAIANGAPGPLWDEFEQWRLSRWRTRTWPAFVDEGFSTVSPPEFSAPEICFVRFLPGQVSQFPAGSGPMSGTALTVGYSGGQWRVAGIGRYLPVPGWPPTEIEVSSDWLAPPR